MRAQGYDSDRKQSLCVLCVVAELLSPRNRNTQKDKSKQKVSRGTFPSTPTRGDLPREAKTTLSLTAQQPEEKSSSGYYSFRVWMGLADFVFQNV